MQFWTQAQLQCYLEPDDLSACLKCYIVLFISLSKLGPYSDSFYNIFFIYFSGKHEPAGEEIEWSDDKDKEEEKELTSRVQEMSIHKDYKEDTKGIPKFWYRVLKNASDAGVLHVKINKDHDEAVLESLLDITVELAPAGDWFRLNFHFAENKWFSNSVLTKEYELSIKPDPDCPLEYDGREISGIKGCKIDWKDKEIQAVDSFFNFFNPLDVDKDTSIPLIKFPLDYDDGLTIKEKILPRAVLFFTGEMKVEYDVSSDDDEDEE